MLVGIEEPEPGLHPDLILKIAAFQWRHRVAANWRRRVWVFDSILVPHFDSRGNELMPDGSYLCHEEGQMPPGTAWRPLGADPGRPSGAERLLDVRCWQFLGRRAGGWNAQAGPADCTMNRNAYLGYGVIEYWCFGHTGGSHSDSVPAGDALVDGEYRPGGDSSQARRSGLGPQRGIETGPVRGSRRTAVP